MKTTTNNFDNLARSIAKGGSRRQLLRLFGVGASAALLGRYSPQLVAAQDDGSSEDYLGITDAGCQLLDKIVTANEDSSGNRERIEVGGGSYQHVDYYPLRGVPTVSYLVGPREVPAVWWGFGSIWEMRMGCDPSAFPWLKDAEGYILGDDHHGNVMRLDQNHSGIVVDLRGDKPEIQNFGKLDDASVKELLELHRCLMRSSEAGNCPDWNGAGNGSGNATDNGGNATPAAAQDTQTGDTSGQKCTPGYTCDENAGDTGTTDSGNTATKDSSGTSNGTTQCEGTGDTHKPEDGTWPVKSAGPIVMTLWSNETSDQTERRYKDLDGGSYTLDTDNTVGGTVTVFPVGCTDAAQAFYDAQASYKKDGQTYERDELTETTLVSGGWGVLAAS